VIDDEQTEFAVHTLDACISEVEQSL